MKSWLLAIPHLVIVGLFAGGAHMGGGGGVITVLVLISMVYLLFTGRPFQQPFDFIMGLNRWVYRVYVYVALMTDEYPPFRIDSGPVEHSGHGTHADRLHPA